MPTVAKAIARHDGKGKRVDLQFADLLEEWIRTETIRVRARHRLKGAMSTSERELRVTVCDTATVRASRARAALEGAVRAEAESRA